MIAIIFQNIETQETALWMLLLFTGYLTYSKKELIEGIIYCDLVIPNKEIKIVYTDLIAVFFKVLYLQMQYNIWLIL